MTSPTKSAAMMTFRLNASSYLRSGGSREMRSGGGVVVLTSGMDESQESLAFPGVAALLLSAEHSPNQKPLAQCGEEPPVLPVPCRSFARLTNDMDVNPVE